MCMETKNTGLRGIEVADTRISDIDGEKGKLIYRGYDITELTKKSNYEETAYLLLHDELPTKEQLSEFKSKLSEARWIPKRECFFRSRSRYSLLSYTFRAPSSRSAFFLKIALLR